MTSNDRFLAAALALDAAAADMADAFAGLREAANEIRGEAGAVCDNARKAIIARLGAAGVVTASDAYFHDPNARAAAIVENFIRRAGVR